MCPCVFVCLMKSSDLGTEFIQLCMFDWFGCKGFGTPMYMVFPPPFGTVNSGFGNFRNHPIQHPLLNRFNLLSATRGFNHALHGASFHARHRISLAPGPKS